MTQERRGRHRAAPESIYHFQLYVALAYMLQAYGVFAETCITGLPSVKEVYTSFVMREVKVPGTVPMPG